MAENNMNAKILFGKWCESTANNYYYSELNTDPAKMIDYLHLENIDYLHLQDADDVFPFN